MDTAPFPDRVRTDRLELEVLPGAVDPMEWYRICSGIADGEESIERVTRYVTWDPYEHPKEAVDFLDHVRGRIESGEGIDYVVRPREGEDGAGQIAGATGLSVDWDCRRATFGTWLREPFWGRGYSGERAAAMLEVAFEHLDLDLVAVGHHVDNENSKRAIERYVEAHGGRRDGVFRNRIVMNGEPVDEVRYSVSREEYREAVGD